MWSQQMHSYMKSHLCHQFAVIKKLVAGIMLADKEAVDSLTIFFLLEKQPKQLCNAENFDVKRRKTQKKRYEKFFEKIYQRDKTAHFVVRVLMKGNPEELSDNRPAAAKISEKIPNSPENIEKPNHEFMEEYGKRNRVKFIDPKENTQKQHYSTPQLRVVRPEKQTTKLRAVFHVSFEPEAGPTIDE